jgi:iron(III) transport system substrate-binding protein
MEYRFFLVMACVVLSCTTESCRSSREPQEVVNVYSHRHYPADRDLFREFETLTGIRVNVLKAGADELINRLELEGATSPADLLITVDAGRLYRAKVKGLLQSVSSPTLNTAVPLYLRDQENTWFGLTTRARIIVYSKERVNPTELGTYEDLTDPKWYGRILVRSSANIYNQSLLASILAAKGSDDARDWAAGIVKNMARVPKGNDRDQIKGISARIGDIALVNSYYLGLLASSSDPIDKAAVEAVGIHFPNQADRGTHINISGAAVTANAPNKDNAILLLEFLTSIQGQRIYAQANYEYPVRQDTSPAPLLASWGEFKSDPLPLSKLGEYNASAVALFDEVGWR